MRIEVLSGNKEFLRKFDAVKENTGISTNTQLIRYLVTVYWKNNVEEKLKVNKVYVEEVKE